MSWVKRRAGPLIILGTSAAGGAAYRFFGLSKASDESLNPHTFTPYTLVDKQPVSSTSAIFTLRNANGIPDSQSVKEVEKRSVWSVQIKQPQLQIARAYTPLPHTADGKKDENAPQDMRLLIRQETRGEVSTYLHKLPEQATIEVRGPNAEFELPRNVKEVIFLAGGTGIAPAMQVAQALSRRTGSQMHILWANRRREECIGGISDDKGTPKPSQNRLGWWKSVLIGSSETATLVGLSQDDTTGSEKLQEKGLIVKELDALKERNTIATQGLRVQYYVDEENTFIQPDDVTKRMVSASQEKGSKLIIVSGPDGFIEHWAGGKLWMDGREVQGPLGGALKGMDLGDWKVFKL
ncbi:Cytochrome-b5 reductase [Ascochyta rabiei]|uniref:Oxidoreductase n=1 Tax=Didymella rabiei TaxID=5454 RepID=A0A163G269_DIDRA|nr:Cytochrome-b5 reductase [Ascochyta rabiei]KZM24646.1 oxidoreductase [Ascochyta rabiei]UPX18364.1 Cytochrome-b5 reductase [Ascochyta rabiei]